MQTGAPTFISLAPKQKEKGSKKLIIKKMHNICKKNFLKFIKTPLKKVYKYITLKNKKYQSK